MVVSVHDKSPWLQGLSICVHTPGLRLARETVLAVSGWVWLQVRLKPVLCVCILQSRLEGTVIPLEVLPVGGKITRKIEDKSS